MLLAAEQRAKNHDLIVENARLLGALGAAAMVVGTDGPADPASAADPVVEITKVFAEVARRVKGTGVTLCLEFNWSPVVKSLSDGSRDCPADARQQRRRIVRSRALPLHADQV